MKRQPDLVDEGETYRQAAGSSCITAGGRWTAQGQWDQRPGAAETSLRGFRTLLQTRFLRVVGAWPPAAPEPLSRGADLSPGSPLEHPQDALVWCSCPPLGQLLWPDGPVGYPALVIVGCTLLPLLPVL